MQIRKATLADLPAVNAIYTHEVLHNTCTFDTVPRTLEQARAWFDAHQSDAYPLLVADVDAAIAGWGTISPWDDKPAYAPAVEFSTYIHPDHRNQRLAVTLGNALMDAARAAGHRVILARIEAANQTSRHLLLEAGFTSVGTLHQVGQKFNKSLDVEIFERILHPAP